MTPATTTTTGRTLFACLTCGRPSEGRYCAAHGVNGKRPGPWQRGYQKTYQESRRQLLASKPLCTRCHTNPATVAHHDPPRRTLLASGVNNVDSPAFLQPVCDTCHRTLTSIGR